MKTTLLLLFTFVCLQASAQQKYVVSTYDNGQPEFVVWLKGKESKEQIVKEMAYYPDGVIEYIGHYKKGKEHGKWTYYYKSGAKKIEENYENGVENGIRYEYATDGTLRLEIHYKDGRIEKEIRHK